MRMEITMIIKARTIFCRDIIDLIPIIKLNNPITELIIAPNILFIFANIALKNNIKNTTCKLIPIRKDCNTILPPKYVSFYLRGNNIPYN